MDLFAELRGKVKGEISTNSDDLGFYSHDASIFDIQPQIVVFPKDSEDVKNTVEVISKLKKKDKNVSITARSGGTDMSGGSLTQSVLMVFPKHFNQFNFKDDLNVYSEPGVYFRTLEFEMNKKGVMLPSYPASKSICCLGGMISNNSGGEKTLAYGKTKDYVTSVKVVLADGNEYEFTKIGKKELQAKMKKNTFEGKIYRKMYYLLEKNYDLIKKSKPDVKKNSAGYYLWDIWDRENFDLSKLIVGSQGTLGIITGANLKLVRKKKNSRLVVCFLKNIEDLTSFVNLVLKHNPESLETFDDNTLKLGLKFMPEIAKKTGHSYLPFLWSFRREAFMNLFSGLPKFTVLVELTDDNLDILNNRIKNLTSEFKANKIKHVVMKNEKDAERYWIIRHESFSLLRSKVKDKHAVAFIDDFAVNPEHLPEFWPRLEEILKRNNVPQTIAGHAGSGNFHIIPLMDLSKKEERDKIHKVSQEVYSLVAEYGGTITAEHNDGLIRTPYLNKMFSPEMIKLFEETKKIFDPQDIFNPGKKVHAEIDYALAHIRKDFD